MVPEPQKYVKQLLFVLFLGILGYCFTYFGELGGVSLGASARCASPPEERQQGFLGRTHEVLMACARR